MQAKDIMTTNVTSLQMDSTLEQAAQVFLAYNFDGAPVIDDQDNLVGLITKNHIMRAFKRHIAPDTEVKAVMTRDVITVSPEDDVVGLFSIKAGRLPVVKNHKIVGIVTRTDLADAYYRTSLTKASELNTLLNAIHNPVISIDRFGIVQACNQAFLKVLQLDNYEQIIGRHLHEVTANPKLFNVVSKGRPEVAQKVTYFGKTYVANRTLIKFNNQITGAVAVLQDISELESISQELQYSKTVSEELNAIIESSFDGIFVTDGQGVVLHANKAYERITGITVSDVIGRSMIDLVGEGFYNRSVTIQVIESQQPITITQEVKGGKVVLVTGNPIFNDAGDIIRVVTNVRDITELNHLEKRLEAVNNLSNQYRQELETLRLQLGCKTDIIVRSRKMQEILELAIRLAGVDSTVLIQGESGVGKELVAEIIHKHSKRESKPYIKLNCGAIPENLLETELFGYEGGTFTGARKEGKAGVFEIAHGGSLFLDEIGEISLNLQVKLLRVLQERTIARVGGTDQIPIDVRIIAATNRNLEDMVKQNTFRKDLFYRLNVVPMTIPPLRQRSEEIPVLAHHFLNKYNRKYGLQCELSEDVTNSLITYDWPGNVRELENIIERLVVTSQNNVIDLNSLPPQLITAINNGPLRPLKLQPLKAAMDELEKDLLTEAFRIYKTTRKVAEVLGINQSTVVRKAARFGLGIDN